jgi:hypothetical protein
MGYKRLIQNSVKTAFKAIGDLAITIEFMNSGQVTFDFATNSSSTPTYTSTFVKGILIKNKKIRSKDGTTTLKSYILFNKADLPDISGYDKVVINNTTWKLSLNDCSDDDFLASIEVVEV